MIFVVKPVVAFRTRLEFRHQHIGFLLVTSMGQPNGEPHHVICRQMEMLTEFIKLDSVGFIKTQHQYVSHSFLLSSL